MTAKDFVLDQSCYGHAIEDVLESFPYLDVESSFAFIVKPVNSVETGDFMVASEQEEIAWVLDFVTEKKDDCLETFGSSIHVISQEQIVG